VRRAGEPARYYRTVKVGSGLSRTELEEEADEATFRRLWPLTKGRRIRKLRFKVPEGDLTWEIDRFRGRRLVLAEVELPSEDTEIPIPDWLRDHIDRDVTGEDEYVNINLAR
jgi:adenylate cyclase